MIVVIIFQHIPVHVSESMIISKFNEVFVIEFELPASPFLLSSFSLDEEFMIIRFEILPDGDPIITEIVSHDCKLLH